MLLSLLYSANHDSIRNCRLTNVAELNQMRALNKPGLIPLNNYVCLTGGKCAFCVCTYSHAILNLVSQAIFVQFCFILMVQRASYYLRQWCWMCITSLVYTREEFDIFNAKPYKGK